jgi:predicted kinase
MKPPTAILIGGAPATGKSTLAAALAARLGAALLDLDVATGPLTNVVSDLIGAADLGDPRMAQLTRAPRYATLFALAEDNLRVGMSVVLVAPFSAPRATGSSSS